MWRIALHPHFPELGLKLARLLRELKLEETVYSLLLEKLEAAKIAEAREAPAVQVIDKARPSRYTARLTTRQSLVFAFCGSLVGAVLLCFSLE